MPIRPADLLAPSFAFALVVWSLASGAPLPAGGNAARAWGMLALLFALIVIVPHALSRAKLPARRRALAGHALFAVFAVSLLLLPAVDRPGDPLVVGIIGLGTLIVYFFGRGRGRYEPAEFLYRFSPFLLAAMAYANLGSILPAPAATSDGWLAAMDLRIFAVHPSLSLERFATPAMDDWFSLHYAIYIAYPVFCGLALYATDRRDDFERLFLRVPLALFAGNLSYAAFPAAGPRVFLLALYRHADLPGGFLTRTQDALVGGYAYRYDSFPSLHTTVSLLAILSIRRAFPRAFLFALFMEANLLASTIFLRMHFVVDLIAGVFFAIAVHQVALTIERARARAPGDVTDVAR